jgi:flagellar biosynthesis regulator FlaF
MRDHRDQNAERLSAGIPTKMTAHAQRRSRERIIPQLIIDALQDYGDTRPAGNGSEEFYFTRKSWKRFASYVGPQADQLEKYRNTYAIIASDGFVVTVAWRH